MYVTTKFVRIFYSRVESGLWTLDSGVPKLLIYIIFEENYGTYFILTHEMGFLLLKDHLCTKNCRNQIC